MKRLIFLLCLGLLTIGAYAQGNTSSATSLYTTIGGSTSYVVNSSTNTSTLVSGALSGNTFLFNYVVQATVSNATGTPAANVYIKCSQDGTNFDYIRSIGTTYPVVADTFKYASGTTTYSWKVPQCGCKYVQVSMTGIGTHSDTLRAKGYLQYIR